MMRAIYRPVYRTRYYSPNDREAGQLAPATLRAGNFLAVICVFFGIAAAFAPASLEQRLGSLLFFGLIPAAAFHVGGFALGRLLGFSSELCEMIAVLCFRCLVRVVRKFMVLVKQFVSYPSATYLIVPTRSVLAKMSSPSENAYRLIHRGCRHADRAIFEFSCLLIRSGARFILRMQACRKMRRR
jgi:hypothetical protein